MNIQMARFTVKANSVKDFEEAIKGVFSAIQKRHPKAFVTPSIDYRMASPISAFLSSGKA